MLVYIDSTLQGFLGNAPEIIEDDAPAAAAGAPMVFFPTHLAVAMCGGAASAAGSLTQIEGSASIAIAGGSAALGVAVAVSGSASIAISCGSAAAGVAVAITGSAAITVTGGSAEISTGSSMAGTASVTVSGGSATLLVAVAIAGSSEVVVLGGSATITTGGGVPMLFFLTHFAIAACGGGATAGTYTIPIAVIAMSYED